MRTCYAYDALGRKISETQPEANLASCPAGPPTTAMPFTSSTRYDAANRVTGTISAEPDGAGGNPFLAVRNSYDAAGRLIKAETGTLPAWQSEAVAPANWSAFAAGRIAETSYDAMGRKTRETLRDGETGQVRRLTQYSYDAAGRLDCTAVRMNLADFAAPPASACAQGTGAADRITRNIYDVADQRLQLREGVGSDVEAAEATWAYNQNGQVTTVIDGNGNRAALRYEGHGRQDRWTFPSTARPPSYNDATQASALDTAGNVNADDFEEYGYDPNGNRTNLRKRDERNIAFAYDDLNRVTAKTYPQGGATAVHYGYDLRNLQLSARFGSTTGEGVTNVYDGFGRLASSSVNLGGTTRTLTYQYDRNGNRTRITHPDSVQFDYSYDGLNRQTWLTDPSSALNHRYEPWGTVNSILRIGGASGRWTTPDGRLISLSHYNGPSFTLDTYWAFTHNPAGQIATQWGMSDAYAWTGHYGVQRPYTTNGLNQYSETGSGAGRAEFTYDANGNLITQTVQNVTQTYVYDIENRLVGAPGNVVLAYDPLGRLYAVSSPTTDTRFLYDGDALVGEYNAAGILQRRYAHAVGADVPVIQYEGTTVSSTTRRYLLANAQGSIVAATDGNSVIQTRNTYDEYGIPGVANTGRFQYTGQIWIPELGMYHYKARIYSPTLGRFLQTDPVGYDDQVNLYAYVGNDPVNLSDPTGMAICGSCSGSSTDGLPWDRNERSKGPPGVAKMAWDTGGAGSDPRGIGDNGGPPLDEDDGFLRRIFGRVGGGILALVTPTAAHAPSPHRGPVRIRFPTNPSQLNHIFRDAPGHYRKNTLNARNAIRWTVQPRHMSHADRFGNQIYGRVHRDGTQTWVQVRNGIIQNAGLNPLPRNLFLQFPSI